MAGGFKSFRAKNAYKSSGLWGTPQLAKPTVESLEQDDCDGAHLGRPMYMYVYGGRPQADVMMMIFLSESQIS